MAVNGKEPELGEVVTSTMNELAARAPSIMSLSERDRLAIAVAVQKGTVRGFQAGCHFAGIVIAKPPEVDPWADKYGG
jgi:hypothetical protein